MTHPQSSGLNDAKSFWEERYSSSERVWSGKVNASAAAALEHLAPGSSLDLGCGEGGDVLWLAERGWRALGLDISPTAVARGEAEARARALPQARFVAADLTSWEPDERFDLVSATFLHSPARLAREDVLTKAMSWVAPGGWMLIVGHAEPPPWSERLHEHRHDLLNAQAQVGALRLGREWAVERQEDVTRAVTDPSGLPAELVDAVVLLRRAAA